MNLASKSDKTYYEFRQPIARQGIAKSTPCLLEILSGGPKPKMRVTGMRYRYIGNGSPFEGQFLTPGAAGGAESFGQMDAVEIGDSDPGGYPES